MVRALDFLISTTGFIFLLPVFLVVYVVCLFDTGKPFFIQERVGKNQKLFKLVKFRTMKINTSSVASHLVEKDQITTIGHRLRKYKLDELPQLWNVIKGEMSLVGPRPNLLNQIDLIQERQKHEVYKVRPGITGLAQINNIDMSRPVLLAEVDSKMIKKMNIFNYFKYLFVTVLGKGRGDAVK
jgi:O-antigen biosynthesis protein WbqP